MHPECWGWDPLLRQKGYVEEANSQGLLYPLQLRGSGVFFPGCEAVHSVWLLWIFKQGIFVFLVQNGDRSKFPKQQLSCLQRKVLWEHVLLQPSFRGNSGTVWNWNVYFPLLLWPCFYSDSIVFWFFGPHIKVKKKFHLGIFQNFHSGKYLMILTFIFLFNLQSGENEINTLASLLETQSCFLISSWHWLSDFGALNWDDGFVRLELIPK